MEDVHSQLVMRGQLASLGRSPTVSRLPGAVLGCRGRFLYTVGAMMLASCVATRSDLDRIHRRLDVMERGGSVEEMRAAIAATKAEVASVAHDVSERGGIAWDTIIYAVTAAAGLCVPSAVATTNIVRNRARAKRGEPVAVPKAKVA